MEVAGIEPTTPCAKTSVTMQVSEFSAEALTEILTEISGKSGQNGSNSVKNGLVKNEPRNRLEPAFFKGKLPKRVSETLVEVAGIEPASRNTSDSASTRVVHFLI